MDRGICRSGLYTLVISNFLSFFLSSSSSETHCCRIAVYTILNLKGRFEVVGVVVVAGRWTFVQRIGIGRGLLGGWGRGLWGRERVVIVVSLFWSIRLVEVVVGGKVAWLMVWSTWDGVVYVIIVCPGDEYGSWFLDEEKMRKCIGDRGMDDYRGMKCIDNSW
jgi:hypothetical protein